MSQTTKRKDTKHSYYLRSWDQWFECATAYYLYHGNLLVPNAYKTVDGYSLGRWIERQRAQYNGVMKRSSLGRDEIERLESIGMVWKLENRSEWSEWKERCLAYYAEHGNLNVPVSYNPDGYNLGYWIHEQRKRRQKHTIPRGIEQFLTEHGITWRIIERHSFAEWFALAKDYFEKHGNLNVPVNYEVDGMYLGRWLTSIRQTYVGKGGRAELTTAQIEALNAIGMIWNMKDYRQNEWNKMFDFVAAYQSDNGKLPLSPEIVTDSGKSTAEWIRTQRQYVRNGRLDLDRVEKLRSIGIG